MRPPDDAVQGVPGSVKPLRLGTERRLPKGMAELYVYKEPPGGNGEDRFGMLGACCCTQTTHLGAYGRPQVDPGTLVTKGMLPAAILQRMRAWSRTKDRLIWWLDAQRDKHSPRLDLVVWDDTAFRIPWELFWLGAKPGSGRRAGWLGGLVTITRYISIQTPWPKLLQTHLGDGWPAPGGGPVTAYIDPRLQHNDRSLLSDFEVEPAASMEDLLANLQRQATALSMVYIAGHGEFAERPEECRLGGLSLLRAYDLGDDGFSRLRNQATLVFLNACYSGEVGIDTEAYNDGALRGFAEVFLRGGAAGVLATSGPIGDALAHAAAAELFAYLRDHPGTSVAEAVRALRQRAARSLAPDVSQPDDLSAQQYAANKELLPVLYWFMFVYYGSPRMAISFADGQGYAAAAGAGLP